MYRVEEVNHAPQEQASGPDHLTRVVEETNEGLQLLQLVCRKAELACHSVNPDPQED